MAYLGLLCQAVSQRDGGDAPKLQAETDAIASGIGIDDEGEVRLASLLHDSQLILDR